jgi:hypothetical protein
MDYSPKWDFCTWKTVLLMTDITAGKSVIRLINSLTIVICYLEVTKRQQKAPLYISDLATNQQLPLSQLYAGIVTKYPQAS